MPHLLLIVGTLFAAAPDDAPPADTTETPVEIDGRDSAAPRGPPSGAEEPTEVDGESTDNAQAAPGDAATSEPKSPRKEGVTNFYVADPSVVKMPEAVQRAVAAAIAQTIEEEGFHAFARDDAREILAQASDLATIGADADGLSLGTLGDAVGADYLVACVISQLKEGGDTVVQMRLVDVPRSKVLVRRESSSADHDGEVLAAVKDATRLILAPLFADMKGSLTITTTEEEADVLIDGTQIGVTPITAPISLPGGHHTVLVRKEGFIRYQETVKIEQGTALTRDVALRPSPAYAQAWREEGELFRTLAWTATGGALVLVGVAAGFGAGWYYFGFVEAPRINDDFAQRVDDEQLNEVTHPDEFATYEGELSDAQFNGTMMSVVGLSAAAVGVAAAGTAAYFWIFGKDPGRYAEFENAAE